LLGGGTGAGTLSAQQVVISGRVLYGPNRKPLAGTWAVLHRVQQMRGTSGPMDSARTGPQGDYRLRIPRADTSAMYVVSSLYQGIAYFSEPVPMRRGSPAPLKPILVYDTSSTGAPIGTRRRLVTVALPSKDGTRAVLELVVLANPGTTTRVASDTTRPTWTGLVPHEAIQFEAGEGDISPQAVGLREDTVLVFGPIPPDDFKQLTYSYILPSTMQRFAIPIGQPISEMDLLLEDTTATVTAPGLENVGVQAIDQRRFAGYRTGALQPGAVVAVTFAPPGFSVQTMLPYVIALVGLALGAGLIVALRRAPSPISAPPSGTDS
jgi:hypothetical protein